MLRRTLTVLTPALFALPLLLTPASQVYADADGMNSVYSATECKVDANAQWTGDAHYLTSYSSPPAPNLKGITNMARSDDSLSRDAVVVNCPLPVLDPTMDSVVVTIVDGTAQDNVACRLRACDGGVGVGDAGTTGSCVDSIWRVSTSANSADGYTPVVEPGHDSNHVSGDLDFITFNYTTEIGTNSISAFADGVAMLGMAGPSSNLSHPGLNLVDFSLECVIPAQDVNQEAAGINTHGYSYIQSYAVNP